MKGATANFHVPLPPALYKALRAAAERQGRPATQAAREAIARWVAAQRRRRLEDELRDYVARAAGGPEDLDETLEASTIEHLTARTRRRR